MDDFKLLFVAGSGESSALHNGRELGQQQSRFTSCNTEGAGLDATKCDNKFVVHGPVSVLRMEDLDQQCWPYEWSQIRLGLSGLCRVTR